MPDVPPAPGSDSRLMPNPGGLLPQGSLTNKHKRWIFYGCAGIVLLIVIANLVATGPKSPQTAGARRPANPIQQQNPTPAQIHDMENTLNLQEAQFLADGKKKAEQLEQARAATQAALPGTAITADDLQRAAALQDAAQARAQYEQTYGAAGGQAAAQRAQLQAEKEQQAYKSLFADNLVRQDLPPTPPQQQVTGSATPSMSESNNSPIATGPAQLRPVATEKEKSRHPLDFDPAAQQNYWLPEGTIMEAVLTNRLDGDAAGPVNCMITTDVYLSGTRLVLIPQGARVLGEAAKVTSLGQQRLAVTFHRIVVPGLREYSVPLDKEPPALAQVGEVGLHDKVDNHYFSIFGASLAVGAIGGLAQVGNGYSGFGYDPSVEFRNGLSMSTAQSADRILDRFLNRLPTVTIREGTRVKILLTADIQVPSYDSMHKGGS